VNELWSVTAAKMKGFERPADESPETMEASGSRRPELSVFAGAQPTCRSCGLRVDKPHAKDADCIAALREEVERLRQASNRHQRDIA
jgi:hypothetical protein